jgi:glycosyltransferase involved in cell wall biosynthesis
MSVVESDKQRDFQGRRILWVSSLRLDVDTCQTSQLEILRNLTQRGHHSTLIAIQSEKRIHSKDLGVNLILVPLRYVPVISPLMFSTILFFLLPLYVVVSRPDFIIVEPDIPILGFMSSILFSKFRKVKLVLDIRSTPVNTDAIPGFMTRVREFLVSYSFATSILTAKKFFDGITIITPLMKNQICTRFNINPKRVGVWTSGVSTRIFNAENYVFQKNVLKTELGLSGKFIVFYHGIISLKRGLVETVEAMSIVKQKFPNVVFFILGAGAQTRAYLENLIQRNQLQESVIIHDAVDYLKVPSYIAICDVGIVPLPNLPYWRFQCPLKLLEYLAMEKVVIATDIPAHRVIIGEAKCGVYISSVKPMEIAKAIEYVYLNKDTLKERGKIGRYIVKRKFTWEKLARDLENYLLSIDC